jgi:transcriptional regulator with PAS, ATPase and Fis domain
MYSIRSVLWIGPSRGLSESGVLDCPSLDVTWVPDVGEALGLPAASFDVEILDGEGKDLAERVKRLRRSPRSSPVLVRTRQPNEAELLAAGARGVWPVDSEPHVSEPLLARIEQLAEDRPWHSPDLRDHEAPPQPVAGVIAISRVMQDVLALVKRAADSTATVLIAGETGTGKEVVARAVHAAGPRASKPCVAVNCAAFPDSLLESELFGHVRGAFTGADRDKPGLFSEANGGTVFLDEIGETSPSLQANLLRVLQEREVRPVGSSRTISLDVRVIAASNRSLREAAERGLFREDLYYRLAVFPISVPPLRVRREDILALAEHFLALHGRREKKQGCSLSRPAAHLLLAHDWPGNVRELENEMQRALALADPGSLITPKLLSAAVCEIVDPIQQSCRPGESLRDNMNRIEAWLIRRALEQHAGRRAASARKLGITREGLYKKMKRLGID